MTLDHPTWPRMVVGNVVIDLLDRDQAMSLLRESLSKSVPLGVLSANLHYLHTFVDHPSWIACRSAAVVTPGELHWLTFLDGMPLIRKANALSGRRWPGLAGSEMLEPILVEAAKLGKSVGFLGGTTETHEALIDVLGVRIPSLSVAGTWAPAKDELLDSGSSQRLAREIREAKTDVLVVALSKPLQEEWIATYGIKTGATLFLSFGAAIDFLAGKVKRAPSVLSSAGVEWAWRLALNPKRLWRRYLIDGPPAWLRLRRSARLLEW